MRVNSKDDKAGGAETGEQKSQNEEAKEEQETQQEEEESTKKSEKKKKNKKEAPPKKTFRDHINDLLNDFKTHGFIYNSPNFFNFIIFTIFCLISTGSAKEQRFWMTYFGLNNENNVFVNIIFNFTLHSFLTENFLSMSYAMILLHSLAHALLPVMGSRNLFIFIMSTAFGSGALIYLFNISLYNYRINTNRRLIAEGKEAQEVHLLKQYGPWDVIHALFLMHYFVHGVGAIQVLNSFSSWVKYACWVGEICILYHNWQPTLAGTIVGLALCRAPMFKQYIKFMPGATPKV